MISEKAAIAAVRFGYGLHPHEKPPAGPEAVLAAVTAPSQRFKSPETIDTAQRFDLRRQRVDLLRELRKTRNRGGDLSEIQARNKKLAKRLRGVRNNDIQRFVDRLVNGKAAFHERLAVFWVDHFTVVLRQPHSAILINDLIDRAIRPHVDGRFAQMLRAVTTHPAMLIYLNQSKSIGPNSKVGQRRTRGLNENLAREILELHTMGVRAAYTQTDVREFAELLTGLTIDNEGFRFGGNMAEPGAETVLGHSYGSDGPARLADVERALDDIAHHPDTAAHLARKLIVHFIGGTPDEALVSAMARVYLDADTALPPMLAVMLDHPSAWSPTLLKAKTPLDFVVSSLRALSDRVPQVGKLNGRKLRGTIIQPIASMGQPLFQANGPDGWPEEPEAWITPVGLTNRLLWSNKLTQDHARDMDPRAFLDTALGPLAGDLLSRAVAGAETRAEGVALVLASPQFNRR